VASEVQRAAELVLPDPDESWCRYQVPRPAAHLRQLVVDGTNPKIVAERLGHSRVEITLDVYSQSVPTMQDGAAGQMERLLNPPKKQAVEANA
jgi:hypothetical protein